MALDNFFTHGQSDTSAGIILLGVQALKNHEDTTEILRVDANAVVAHAEHPVSLSRFDANMDTRSCWSAKLDRVAQKILKELNQLHRVTAHSRQRIMRDNGFSFI